MKIEETARNTANIMWNGGQLEINIVPVNRACPQNRTLKNMQHACKGVGKFRSTVFDSFRRFFPKLFVVYFNTLLAVSEKIARKSLKN